MSTWRCSFRKKNSRLVRYHGDLVLRHDVAAYTWSCLVRLVGTLEIFLVFCSGRGIVGGKGAIALTIRAIGAIEFKSRGIDHLKK